VNTAARTTPSFAPIASLYFRCHSRCYLFGGTAFEPGRGPSQGTVSFCTVRLTGAGATAGVKLVFRPDATKTGPPPAPTADVFSAVKGTYSSALSGPGIVPVAFVGLLELEISTFVYLVAAATKEKTFETVL
jgi:hypothetical protein